MKQFRRDMIKNIIFGQLVYLFTGLGAAWLYGIYLCYYYDNPKYLPLALVLSCVFFLIAFVLFYIRKRMKQKIYEVELDKKIEYASIIKTLDQEKKYKNLIKRDHYSLYNKKSLCLGTFDFSSKAFDVRLFEKNSAENEAEVEIRVRKWWASSITNAEIVIAKDYDKQLEEYINRSVDIVKYRILKKDKVKVRVFIVDNKMYIPFVNYKLKNLLKIDRYKDVVEIIYKLLNK